MNEKKANRLIDSKSPYLLPHAYNPVDWYEWGEEAFDRAKKENKPIFLSIGYSTCHWCHVMEHQSFENEEIAGLMNLTFVNIKVDREERPDIDSIYMEVCQMLTGSGGWPLTIIMTSDKKPFFAGTYFPPQSVPGRIGMIDLIGRINDIWKNKRDLAESSANDIVAKLSEVSNDSSGIQLNKSVIKAAANSLISGFDKKKGGFSPSPKFPIPHNITFLLRYGSLVKSKEVLNMAYKTLDEMRLGGVYDQIGFGFHRYSTDANWLLPHFEKMLYDQAGLIIAYSEAYQLSGNENYKNTVYEIVDYLKREMLSPEGGFYSAEDADSEGVEGKFYVWTMEEISNILGSEAERFASIFNMKEDGNYFDEAGEYNKDKNIPHLKDIKYLSNEEKEFIEECRIKLFNVREERIHPYKDDKILTDWNGFIIAALSFAGFVFDNNEFVQLAENAAGFVLEKMADEDNSLLHRFRQGNADIKGMLDDYAFMTYGLLQLYESTSDIKYLDWAVKLTDFTLQNFMDEKDGGFYQTSKDSELLFKRHKDIYDGAMPSGNSVMMHNLVKLHKITDEYKYLKAIEKSMTFFSGKIMHYPAGYTKYISSLFSIFKESSEIVIAGSKHDSNFNDIIDVLRRNFIPFLIVLFLDRDVGISKYSKWTENMKLESGKTTVYFCKNYACSQPTSDADELEKMLMDLK